MSRAHAVLWKIWGLPKIPIYVACFYFPNNIFQQSGLCRAAYVLGQYSQALLRWMEADYVLQWSHTLHTLLHFIPRTIIYSQCTILFSQLGNTLYTSIHGTRVVATYIHIHTLFNNTTRAEQRKIWYMHPIRRSYFIVPLEVSVLWQSCQWRYPWTHSSPEITVR